MIDLKELYSEIVSGEELKKEFLDAAEKGKIEDFLKAHCSDAGLEDIQAFPLNKGGEMKPLSAEETDNAAGETCSEQTKYEAILSAISVGTTCGIMTACSAYSGGA